MKRAAQVVGLVLLVLGVFWAGRESSHGLAAFFEHWWCPIPLVVIVLGMASMFTSERLSRAI